MRAIDRVKAFQAITNTMLNNMEHDDVRVFFQHKKISLANPDGFRIRSRYNLTSYIRNYLENCNDNQLIEIADELELGLTIEDQRAAQLGESTYWLPYHFRLFISHVHTNKASAAALKDSLLRYGITSFVAHEDIHVSTEWRTEILRALMSMDALTAIVSSDFKNSNWTDQEVGAAIARDIVIIPINKGLQPYGFLEQFQNFKSTGKNVREVADLIFETIANNAKTKDVLAESLVMQFSVLNDPDAAAIKIKALAKIPNLSDEIWETASSNISRNNVLIEDKSFVETVNHHLREKFLEPIIGLDLNPFDEYDDDIPF